MEKLTEILNQELEIFDEFLQLLDQQHKQIISRDIEELNKTNTRLDLLSQKANHLEKNRIEIVEEIAGRPEFQKDGLTLSDILPKLDRVSGNRLKLLRDSIKNTHQRIEEKSVRNKKLIENSRKLISDSMKILAKRPSPVYQKPGPAQPAIREGSLVNRSI